MFASDKLAYVYDLQSSLVESLAEQTRSTLENLADRAKGVGAGSGDFSHAPELFRVRVYRTGAGKPVLERTLLNRAALERAGLEVEDLDRHGGRTG